MPAYYTRSRQATTSGTGNTAVSHLRLLTIANQQNCAVVQIMAAARNSTTAGSGVLGVGRMSTASTVGGTAANPTAMNPGTAAASTTGFDDATAFTTNTGITYQFFVGFAQTGGQGGWVALERDNAVMLAPNGGANGNVTLDSFTATPSQALAVSYQILEG